MFGFSAILQGVLNGLLNWIVATILSGLGLPLT